MFTTRDLASLVPPKVFDRGEALYSEEDAVGRIRQQGSVFKATVQGSERYHVELTLRAGGPPDIVCDCPYDYGPVCKHGIALGLAVLDLTGEKAPELPAPPADETYTTQQLQKALLTALSRVSEKERLSYLAHLLYNSPGLIQKFLDAFEFSVPLLLAAARPKPRPVARTFVQVGEINIRDGYGDNMLAFLLRYDWRGVPADEAPRMAALLAHAARQQPEATLDAVMERTEKYLTATQRGPGLYPGLVGWLVALRDVPALTDEVHLFASELWRQYSRRAELRGALTEAGFEPLPADEQEQLWRKNKAAAAKKPPQKRGREAR